MVESMISAVLLPQILKPYGLTYAIGLTAKVDFPVSRSSPVSGCNFSISKLPYFIKGSPK